MLAPFGNVAITHSPWASPPLTLSAPTWAVMPLTPATRRSIVTTGTLLSTAVCSAGAMALTSIGLMTMPLTPWTTAASTSAVCLGAEFWPSDSTVLMPSAAPSSCIAFSMWTKNGKFRPGTDVITVTSCARAVPAPNATSPATATPVEHRPDRPCHFPTSLEPRPDLWVPAAAGTVVRSHLPVNRFRDWKPTIGIGHTRPNGGRGSWTSGSSGARHLRVAPLCLGGNVFGWTADRRRRSDCSTGRSRRGSISSTRPRCTRSGSQAIAAANPRRSSASGWQSRRCRDRVVIATKVGADMGDGRKGLAPARIRDGVEGSLRRLRTDSIDLYWAHYDDADTPLEEVLGTFAELIEEGKVRVIGASNHTPARLRAALAVSEAEGLPRYESLQPHYNLYDRAEYEAELEPLCVEHGLGVISYFGLAKGFLTGKYRSEADLGQSQRGGGVAGYLNERGLRILAALDEVAGEIGATPAQVALAWLMARPSITAPIASATRLEHVEDLIAAMRADPGQGGDRAAGFGQRLNDAIATNLRSYPDA